MAAVLGSFKRWRLISFAEKEENTESFLDDLLTSDEYGRPLRRDYFSLMPACLHQSLEGRQV